MLARLFKAFLGPIFFLCLLLPVVAYAQPTTQPSSFTAIDVGSGTIGLSWTRGDGDFVVIVAKESSAVDSDPQDNNSYSTARFGDGALLGSGNYVVYVGTATSTTVRGLSASTTYHFAAYEFNTGGSPDPDYLTTGEPTTSATTTSALILYSFQTGNAETASTWTTDASGVSQVNSAVPGPLDETVVLSGRTVTVTEDDFDVTTMRIESGGTLSLGTTDGHAFTTMSGTGLVVTAENHPSVTTNDFASASGGTFEYATGGGSITITAVAESTYNNLTIDNTSITIGVDLTINGTLTLENTSTMTLGNGGVVRDFSFNDITVGSGSAIETNATTVIHTATITGSVTNEGTINFTAQTSAEYTTNPTAGVVEVTFSGSSSSTLSCSGETDFYRLILDKGTGPTLSLVVSSTSTSNFRIFGRNNQANTSSGDAANPIINKALWIKNGTLELGSNIDLPSLTEGGFNYIIPENGALYINGADVDVTTTSNGSSAQALVIIGELHIGAGTFETRNSFGIFYASAASLDIDGGTITASQLRAFNTTIGDQNTLAYNQSGGTVNIDRSGANTTANARFELEASDLVSTSNSFVMSGGTLNISNPNASGEGIYIATKAEDFSATGGTVVLQVNNSTDFGIAVSGTFFNLTLEEDGDGATGDFSLVDNGPITSSALSVDGDLVLQTNAVLLLSGDDLNVGGNLTINTGTTLTPGSNTMTFNGTGAQALTIDGTLTSINNLTVNKSSNTFTPSTALSVGGDLNITAGTFADGGFAHTVSGNVTNSGSHTGSGSISLNGTSTQTIGGDGTGEFQNLTLNNSNAAAAPISTSAAITINGTLTFSNDKIFSIGSNLLTFGGSAATSGSNSSRYIQTSGLLSDGGITKTYSTTGSFTWPIGSSGGSVYTPATINVGTATTTGDINIKTVESEHPNVTTTGLSLTYYWEVSSTGFSAISNVTHTYVYDDSDIVATESDYIFGRYNSSNSTWTTGVTGDVDESTNTIGGTGNLSGVTYIDGGFTAGDADPTTPFDAVTIFYSRNDAPNITTTGADWDTDDGGNKTTWSTSAHSGSSSTQLPEDVQGASVIIASGHIVEVTSSSKTVGSVELTGTLDLGTTTSQDLGTLTGTGELRISSSTTTAEFPSGDNSDFTGTSGGTVTYYKNAAQDFTLPASPTTYRNLTIEAGTGSSAGTLDLPAADLTITNDFTITDGSGASNSGTVRIAESNNFSVQNDLILTSENSQTADLDFRATGTARSISISGDFTVGTNNSVDVTSGNSLTHALTITGSLTNNGTFDLVPTSGTSVSTTFDGSSSTSITGTGSTTDFGAVTVNKGSSSATELNVNATAFDLESLTLTNGSFRLTSSQTINVSTTTFTIPSTARLAVSGGTVQMATAAADGNDLFLQGELEVISGTVEIGNTANANNNDIEYSSTGSPTIDIQGGTMTVNGQIRRATSTTAGDLTFSQAGGTLNIGGNNTATERAKLEVVNSGSFTMSSGTINIIRGGGDTFYDLYLHPGSSSVTGGTIVFEPGSNGDQTYGFSTDITLNNIAVTGNGASNEASLTLRDQATSINGLTISEANSTFDANGLALNIAGDFSNTGTFTANSNTTTFNGSAAQAAAINAATSFHNLVMDKSGGTLTLSGSSDITVTNDLTLTNGTIEDGSRTINVTGDVTNNATHTSGTVGTGGISFSDANHTISGTGTFGNITLTGTSRTVTVGSAITINGDLDFTGTVVFDIENNALTMGSDATITGTSFSSSKMIRLASGNTIQKSFPASATDFTFPIGISGDYTPVRTNLTANSATGSITASVQNVRHPLTTSGSNLELLRYWTLATSGLNGTATLVFTYVDGDVQGTESSYFGGRELNSDWSPAGGREFDDAPTNSVRTVDDSNNTITWSGQATGDIAADYTAGETAEFVSSVTYFSRTTGNWEDASTWSTTDHNGSAATSTPDGHSVDIDAGDVVTVTSDAATSNDIIIDGTLALGATINNSIGTVTGTGLITLSATGSSAFNFPTADISGYTGTVEYNGTTNGTLTNTPSAFHNLTFSGSSTKDLQNAAFSVNNDLTMSAGTLNQANDVTVSVAGNFTNSGATFNATSGTFDFNGTGTQAITASGGSTTFNTFTVSNTAGSVGISGSINMNGAFTQAASTTLDLDDNSIGGSGAVTVNGRIETSNTNGLSGGASTAFTSAHSGVTLNAGSTIAFDAAGAQTLTGRTDYDGLEVGGSGTKTLDGATTVAGSLNISAGELAIGSNTLTLNGTITGAGTIAGSTTSDITIGGTGDLGTIDFSSGSETLGDLVVNRTSSGTVTFEESFTINTTATFTEGIINLANNSLITVGASGSPATVTGGSETTYFNTDPVDDDLEDNPEIDLFLETGEVTIPMGYNPFFSISLSCPSCSGHRFQARIRRGPYLSPPSSGGRQTTDVVAAQWSLRKTAGATVDVTVTLCWSGSAETTGLGTNVGISYWNTNDTSPFWNVGSNIAAKSGSDPYCRSRTITVNGGNRIFMAITNDQSPLPITLLSFNGEMNDQGDVDLYWETVDEVNNDFFEVQRSGNGIDGWEGLGTIQGAGTTSAVSSYTFTDDQPNKESGQIYYRLRQVDFNGIEEYSPVIAVSVDESLFDKDREMWKVYPNPSHGYDLEMVLTNPRFEASDTFRFRLLNSAGQVVYDQDATGIKGSTAVKDLLTFAASGIYILEISTDDKVERHRLIKQ